MGEVDALNVVDETGGLSIGGEVFLYWNTAVDGSGTIQTGGSTFTFTADVTLYAQWGVTTGLTGGGKKSGSGRGQPMDTSPSRKGGRIGGKASASRPASARSASAKKAAATRKRRASR